MEWCAETVDRRDTERLAVNLDVLIHPYRAAPVLCMMHDVSASGALLTTCGAGDFEAGDEVLVESTAMELVATIAWIADDRCGVRFHRRLHAYEVAALRTIEHDQAPFVPPPRAGSTAPAYYAAAHHDAAHHALTYREMAY